MFFYFIGYAKVWKFSNFEKWGKMWKSKEKFHGEIRRRKSYKYVYIYIYIYIYILYIHIYVCVKNCNIHTDG